MATSRSTSIMSGEMEAAAGDVPVVHEDDRKLFVGALPQEAGDDDIKEYFEQLERSTTSTSRW